MTRLILFVFLLAGLALAFAAVMNGLRALQAPQPDGDAKGLPAPLRMISYTLLMIVMLGVSSGLLGAG